MHKTFTATTIHMPNIKSGSFQVAVIYDTFQCLTRVILLTFEFFYLFQYILICLTKYFYLHSKGLLLRSDKTAQTAFHLSKEDNVFFTNSDRAKVVNVTP